MSEFFLSVCQGLIQGLTEFLPVSSSGHLSIFQHITGTASPAIIFDLVLHLATVCATFLFFAKDIWKLLIEFFVGFVPGSQKGEGWSFGWAVIAGTIPTAIVGLVLEPVVQPAAESMLAVGTALMITAALMLLLCFVPDGNRNINVVIGVFVGMAQGLAVIPGISRSGATIAAGLICGLMSEQAFRFSFLLSLPAVVGAALLEFLGADLSTALPSGWLAGAAAAFVSGYAALYALRSVVIRGKFGIFAVYCLIVGCCAVFLL